MPSNIEIKAHINNFEMVKEIATTLSDQPATILHQEDIFFHSPQGRLKLRIFSPTQGELIFYQRSDDANARQSHYLISPTTNPYSLKDTLAAAYGIRGVVKKTRLLFIVGQTRIHLDTVDNLGNFIELEFVLKPDQDHQAGLTTITELMEKLLINKEDICADAYIDMILRQ